MTWWAKRLLIALVLSLAALTILLGPRPAGAQPPRPPASGQPPESGTPGQQPQPTQPPANEPAGGGEGGQAEPTPDAAEVIQAARDASVSLATEIAIINALNGFIDPSAIPAELQALFDEYGLVPEGDRADLLLALQDADARTAAEVATLQANGVIIDPLRVVATDELSEADVQTLESGGTISVTADTYVLTLGDLASPRNGRPPQQINTEVDVNELVSQLDQLLAAATGTTPTSATDETTVTTAASAPSNDETAGASEGDSGHSETPIYIGGGLFGLIAIVVVVAFFVSRRRRSTSEGDLDDLLDVSRRLAAAVDPEDVARIGVGEAVRMSGASAGALIHRRDGTYIAGYESSEGMLVSEHLGEGVIDRVCQSGQKVSQVSNNEPAIRNLPVSLVAIPVVAGGTVSSVLVLVRPSTTPFTEVETDLLLSLAPVIGATLETARSKGEAEERSLIDPLTEVGNRRRFEDELALLLGDDSQAPTALVMVDLDHFKSVNDTHGHPAGDEVLRSVAAVLQRHLRPRDAVYRYGGEEFCLVLPGADDAEAHQIADRIRAAIESEAARLPGGVELSVTASMGVATSVGGPRDDLVDRADAALYEAKENGRNQVVIAGPPG